MMSKRSYKPSVKMWVKLIAFCILIVGAGAGGGAASKKKANVAAVGVASVSLDSLNGKPTTGLTADPLKSLLVLATLDGSLTAVDRISGELRWVSKDEPMIKVPAGPASAKAPYFLPDPKTGSLYVMGKRNTLKKMPFSIPQLVAMAPCKNSEGIMYTGRKMDYWLQLNPHTGEKSEVLQYADSTCPVDAVNDSEGGGSGSCSNEATEATLGAGLKKSLIIGKTEYTLSMADGPRKWNVSYHHYSSMDMSSQSKDDYDLVHFTSPSSGTVLTYDKKSQQLLWQRDLKSPVVAVYAVDCATSNLINVPFNPIAPETLDRLQSNSVREDTKPLSSKTYIGESNYGLYAVPALVDELVFLMSGEGGTPYPPLIEGPENNQEETVDSTPEGNQNESTSSSTVGEGDLILLGYWDVADPPGKPPAMQIGQVHHHEGEILPPGLRNESNFLGDDGSKTLPTPSNLELSDPVSTDTSPNKLPPLLSNSNEATGAKPKEIKPVKIVLTTAMISVVVTVSCIVVAAWAYQRMGTKAEISPPSSATLTEDRGSNRTQYSSHSTKSTGTAFGDMESGEEDLLIQKIYRNQDGSEISIGKIAYCPGSLLGKGCEGTFVYKGKFEGRDVAVKRILPECFQFADREVELLRESDQHANVIRYFCTEFDGHFRYIALELCDATLSEWVEKKGNFQGDILPPVEIDPIEILREATDGLAHLHSLRIVHRDVKPANVLLSVSENGSGFRVRTMISDFGLCKKITNGRMSFSRRSGGIPGTEGWIAPEVLKNLERGSPSSSPVHRMSYSVDVFSLGCVYYYVLTKGHHPFGDPFRRQSNIVNGDYDLDKLQSHPQGLYDLINLMICPDPTMRPPLYEILAHPMFWPKERILTFFLDVSDRIEKEDENRCGLLRRLENDGTRIVKGDWRDHICAEVAMDLRKYRTYKGQSVRDLLRALRNKKNHYRELTPEAQASLGHIPDEFTTYWISRFPELLPYTWLKFESIRKEPIFAKYYPKEFSFNWAINGEDPDDLENDDGFCDNDRLTVNSNSRSISPDKSPKIDKNFWRSKSQFKYNKWRQRQQQNPLVRENPHNFTSFATKPTAGGLPSNPPPPPSNSPSLADLDPSWRNRERSPKPK